MLPLNWMICPVFLFRCPSECPGSGTVSYKLFVAKYWIQYSRTLRGYWSAQGSLIHLLKASRHMFCKCLILSLFPAISVSHVKCVPLLFSLHVWKYYIAHVIGCCSSRLVFFSFPFSRSPYSFYHFPVLLWGFPNSSSGEESTCNAGDPSSIPGWEDPLKKG